MQRNIIAGIVTTKGKFVSSSDLRQKYGMRVKRDGTEHYKMLPVDTMQKTRAADLTDDVAQSREVQEDMDPFDYNSDNIVVSPWAFPVLSELLTSNVVHSAAIETKAADYALNGWDLELTSWAKANIDETTLEKAKGVAQQFLESAAGGGPIDDVLRDTIIDFESLGSGAFECLRSSEGELVKINHVPFNYVRIAKGQFYDDTGARYLQNRFFQKRWFTDFGDNVNHTDKLGNPFNPRMAHPEEFPDFAERLSHIQPHDDAPDFKTAGMTSDPDRMANEMYMMARPPFTKSSLYGTPAGISAFSSMLAQIAIDKYNISFFETKGVPQYAVVFSGMQMPAATEGINEDDPSPDDDPELAGSEFVQVQNIIQEFFQEKLEASSRSVLVLGTWGEVEVTFQKLSEGGLDASFAEYEKRNREAVRMAHRVPPAAIGMAETANLGSGRDTSQLRRYRDHIVNPGQRTLEKLVHILLRDGLMIPYFNFKMVPMTVEEEADKREWALKEYIAGASMLDDYLESTGREPLPDGRGQVYVIRSTSLTVFPRDPMNKEALVVNTIEAEKRFAAVLSGRATFDDIERTEKDIQRTIDDMFETNAPTEGVTA